MKDEYFDALEASKEGMWLKELYDVLMVVERTS